MVDYVNQKVSPNDQWLFDTDGDLIGVRNPRVRGRDLTPVTSAEHLLDNLTAVTSSGVTAASDSLPIAVSGVMKKISIDELQKSAAPQSATTPTYGSDLLAGIGAFPDATGWTLGSGWSITGGQAVYTSGGGTLDATISVVSGTKYQIDWTHVSGTYNITVTAGAVSTGAQPYWGNKSLTFVASATGSVTLSIAMSSAATIDAFTVRQVLTAGRAVACQILDASGAVAFAPAVTAAALNNTANGVSALYSNTTGYYNTANGVSALYSNTTGYQNTANGVDALRSNTTGYSNTANGVEALRNNTTGYQNTANGVNALRSNTTGYSNTANGVSALRNNTTGYQNTANGVSALYNNTTGYYNTANGISALDSNTTGYQNTANGVDALVSNTTGYSNTANGVNALRSNTTGYSNTANGVNALRSNTTGNYNVASGASALYALTTGSGNSALGSQHTSGGVYSPLLAVTTENDRLMVGHTGVTNAYVQVAWTVVSDARDKCRFAPVPHGLDFVNKLSPVAYQFRESRDSDTPHGPVRYGFRAQDILALEGDSPVIIDAETPDKLRYQGEALTPVLVNAIQELTAKLAAMQLEINALKGA